MSTLRRPTLAALSIVTRDMPSALTFYRQCGLEFPDGAENEAHAETTNGPLRLLFDTYAVAESFQPGWQPPTGTPRMSLAFECASRDEVDAIYADLVAAGHRSELAPFDAPWGQRYAVLLDPDDNTVDFFCA